MIGYLNPLDLCNVVCAKAFGSLSLSAFRDENDLFGLQSFYLLVFDWNRVMIRNGDCYDGLMRH